MKNCPKCGAPQADCLPVCDLCNSVFPGEKRPKEWKIINFPGVFGLLCAILAVVSTYLIVHFAIKMDSTEDSYEILTLAVAFLLALAGAITLPIAGMILSCIGAKMNKYPHIWGKGFVIAGIILSSLTLVISVLFILLVVLFIFYAIGSV